MFWEVVAPAAMLIATMLVIGSIARTSIVNRRLRETARASAELQMKLVEKFSSAEEVVRYLESSAGKNLLEATPAPNAPTSRVLDSVHLGLLVLMGGIGLSAANSALGLEGHAGLQAMGLVAVLVGVGFLLSAGASWYLLRGWGLLGRKNSSDEPSENG
ncbi:MAG TPA: hypothetical protein PK413_09290 [Thermoanaerobaculia bacterium]|nr:hypothetical protein [Thermoanaerobaculia bacterium]